MHVQVVVPDFLTIVRNLHKGIFVEPHIKRWSTNNSTSKVQTGHGTHTNLHQHCLCPCVEREKEEARPKVGEVHIGRVLNRAKGV